MQSLPHQEHVIDIEPVIVGRTRQLPFLDHLIFILGSVQIHAFGVLFLEDGGVHEAVGPLLLILDFDRFGSRI